jgi:polyhydroxybutyrate depolymerase
VHALRLHPFATAAITSLAVLPNTTLAGAHAAWLRLTPAVTLDVALPTSDGDRTYRLHVPAFFGSPPRRPLLIALHGLGGSGPTMAASSGLSAEADHYGFAVAYPSALGHRWNDGRVGAAAPDDVAFLDTLVSDVAGRTAITRVFVAGMSNGGFLALRLACERSGRYAGFAAVSASLPAAVQPHCAPSADPAVMIVHGDADPLVPFGGGADRVDGAPVLGVPATANYYAEQAGCPAHWSTRSFDLVPRDGTSIAVWNAQPCRGEPVNVTVWQVLHGGHAWPGSRMLVPASWRVGRTSHEFSASREIMAFFAALPD